MHGRGCAWQGACVVGACMPEGACVAEGGMCGRGHAWQGGMHGGGHAWQRGVCGRGGMHGMHPPDRYYEIWSMRRQYASYWNAFLLSKGLLGLCCLIETRDCIERITLTAVLFE